MCVYVYVYEGLPISRIIVAIEIEIEIEIGRTRAEAQRGEMDLHRSHFQQLPWSTESVSLKITPKK